MALYRTNINDSQNTKFCLGCFEFHCRKIFATAPKNWKKYAELILVDGVEFFVWPASF